MAPVQASQNTISRESLLRAYEKAQAERLQVDELDPQTFQVKDYLITVSNPGLLTALYCTCPHGINHPDGVCKHRAAVIAYRKYGLQPFAPINN